MSCLEWSIQLAFRLNMFENPFKSWDNVCGVEEIWSNQIQLIGSISGLQTFMEIIIVISTE